ncbi:MAG: SufE family protein [Verrucomicrobiota bacterium]|nr:SufE family protein [Verrucomicrobiota bacterium]
MNAREQLLRELSTFRGNQERLAWIIKKGKEQPAFPESARTEKNRVEGCLSNLWLLSRMESGRCWFQSDSDSSIVRGLASVICELFSELSPMEILQADVAALLQEAGLSHQLTPNRRNATTALAQKIKDYAREQA